jgi:hypothetical protein
MSTPLSMQSTTDMTNDNTTTNEITTKALWDNLSRMTDLAMKKRLTASLDPIDTNTADASVLFALSVQRTHAVAIASKLDTRIRKRNDQMIVRSYGYWIPHSELLTQTELAKIASDKTKKAEDEASSDKRLSPEAKAHLIKSNAEAAATAVRYNEACVQKRKRDDEKEIELALWFNTHCSKIDEKVDAITAKIPGYCAAIVIPPPAKKSKPNAYEVQTTLAHAFRATDSVEPRALLSNLNSQLQESDIAAGKLAKSISTRDAKLQSRPVTKKELKHNKGVRMLEYDAQQKDYNDKMLSYWFQQHSLAIKTKIATVGQVV